MRISKQVFTIALLVISSNILACSSKQGEISPTLASQEDQNEKYLIAENRKGYVIDADGKKVETIDGIPTQEVKQRPNVLDQEPDETIKSLRRSSIFFQNSDSFPPFY